MLIQSSVGQPTQQGIGATPNLRSGKGGDVIASELHSKYYEQTYNGNVFFVANQVAVTTTIGLATTYTGLVLTNPIGSTVNLAILKATFNQSVLQTTQPMAFGLATGFNATTQVTHSGAITPRTAKVGSGATPQALADNSATLPTAPIYTHFIGAGSTATADATFGFVDLDASLLIGPGGYICWVCPTQVSVTTSLWFSFSWEETPI